MQIYSQYVTPEGIQSLKNYKYSPGVYTPLDNFINPYWIKATEYLPRWLAPNLITLTGTLLVLSSTILFTYFDRKVSADQPWYAFVWAAISIFLYCQLDAMDGKQARRLGLGSPLGQLFDHGCDCICVSLFTYNLIVMWKLGNDLPSCFLVCFATMFMFYSSNWAEYHTHVLVTSNGVTGVTELEVIFTALNLLTAFFGPSIWQTHLFFGHLIRHQTLSCSARRHSHSRLHLHFEHPSRRLQSLQIQTVVLENDGPDFTGLRVRFPDLRDNGSRPLFPL